jgi:hypothetical protein
MQKRTIRHWLNRSLASLMTPRIAEFGKLRGVRSEFELLTQLAQQDFGLGSQGAGSVHVARG